MVSEYLRSIPATDAGIAAVFPLRTRLPRPRRNHAQVGGRLLWQAVAELSGKSEAELTDPYRRHGDWRGRWRRRFAGKESVLAARQTWKRAFDQIAAARGPAPKSALLRALLETASPLEAKYIVKIMTETSASA